MKCELCDVEKGFYIKDTAERLNPNTFMSVHCESCGLSFIGKTSTKEIKVGYISGVSENETIPVSWVSYEELLDTHQQIKNNYEKNLYEQRSH